ncbi:hypothetical protein, partial [Bartonella capreoli]|uniref:hypothetical protein n=1 Tax=Bartonella capreoli TaxID=155192 RepID=UPI001ABD0DC0
FYSFLSFKYFAHMSVPFVIGKEMLLIDSTYNRLEMRESEQYSCHSLNMQNNKTPLRIHVFI